MMKKSHEPIIVAVSGQGRLLSHLLDVEHNYNYQVVGVVASSKECGGYQVAKSRGLPVYAGQFPKAGEVSNSQLATEVAKFTKSLTPRLTVLAGFLRPFPHLSDPMAINIHPALLPKFSGLGLYGTRVHQAVIQSQDRVSGATCHWVSEEYDAGQILSQVVVPRFPSDTPSSLAQRVFLSERSLLPQSIELALSHLASSQSKTF